MSTDSKKIVDDYRRQGRFFLDPEWEDAYKKIEEAMERIRTFDEDLPIPEGSRDAICRPSCPCGWRFDPHTKILEWDQRTVMLDRDFEWLTYILERVLRPNYCRMEGKIVKQIYVRYLQPTNLFSTEQGWHTHSLLWAHDGDIEEFRWDRWEQVIQVEQIERDKKRKRVEERQQSNQTLKKFKATNDCSDYDEFVRSSCTTGNVNTHCVSSEEITKAYEDWCTFKGKRAFTNHFRQYLGELDGVQKGRKSKKTYYLGVRLNSTFPNTNTNGNFSPKTSSDTSSEE
jgi:hypothetical protein